MWAREPKEAAAQVSRKPTAPTRVANLVIAPVSRKPTVPTRMAPTAPTRVANPVSRKPTVLTRMAPNLATALRMAPVVAAESVGEAAPEV